MGLLSNHLGKIEAKAKEEINTLLIDGEEIEAFYIVKEDYCCLTNKRALFVDNNVLNSKKSTTGIPYKKISAVSIKKGGMFSISKEVVITIGSRHVEINLYDPNQALEIFKKISAKIC